MQVKVLKFKRTKLYLLTKIQKLMRKKQISNKKIQISLHNIIYVN